MVNKRAIQNCLSLKMLAEACQDIWNDVDPNSGYTEEQCMVPMAKMARDMLELGGYFDREDQEEAHPLPVGRAFPSLHKDNILFQYLKKEYGIVPQMELDLGTPFHLCVQTEGSGRIQGERLLQYLLYGSLRDFGKGEFQWVCVDAWKGGKSFGALEKLAWSGRELSGNKIYTSERDIRDAIDVLEARSREIMEKLAGSYDSVYAYNREHKKPIPLTLALFCDIDKNKMYSVSSRLQWIQENGAVTGIHVIFLEEKGAESDYISPEAIHIAFTETEASLSMGEKTLEMDREMTEISEPNIKDMLEKMSQEELIDTTFETHVSQEEDFFKMDATEMLRIPFAIDEEEEICYLELGGAAPPHALISGTTGSGKSVTLHTIIEQILLNYHPDDVEIWAIDYKAVEFNCYVTKKTPHIRVIGQDNSMEFSISLLNLILKEYERRKELFVQEGVRDFEGYRGRYGHRSLPRVLIIIDEFHNLTQAVQNYTGGRDYKVILENLLRETRAMGISFLFCSQTIAAGLGGLSDAGRNQIGCRLCMLQNDRNEIQETLGLPSGADFDIGEVSRLGKGQIFYKKPRYQAVAGDGGPGYSLGKYNVLYISEEKRSRIIDEVNEALGDNYRKKEDIISRGSSRYPVSEKPRHTLSRFVNGEQIEAMEELTYFFAAPKTLEHEFRVTPGDEAGSNVLLVGENDDLRESIIMHSVLGLLLSEENQIYVSVLDEENEDSKRLCAHLQNIASSRLHLSVGISQVLDTIGSVEKIRPLRGERRIYFWYGLNKLKNALFLLSQEEEEQDGAGAEAIAEPEGLEAQMQALEALLGQMGGAETPEVPEKKQEQAKAMDFDTCVRILQNLMEYGPENGYYNFSVYNQRKAWKKGGIEKLSEFEHRIGLKMSEDDSYELFGSTSFISKVDEKSAVYYSGSRTGTPLLPYLLPTDQWYAQFNRRLNGGKENG